MGASAGGLEAFERFFRHMPADSGLAFVLVPHLDAHHKSAMVELVARFTRMPVVQISDGMTVAVDRIHVIPPNTTLTMRGDVFRIETPRSHSSTIDSFFRSVAEQHGEFSAGIILSGSGSDGSIGLKAIKEAGGLTLAQAGETSRYDSMPRSAIATGLVDFVLPVEEMPPQLVQYSRNLARLKREGTPLRQETRRHLVKIFTLLRTSTGHDFSQYKNNTFVRRLHRRMQVLQVATMADYVELLRKESQEVEALFRDLLIGVTHFFRDAKAFEVLEREVLPKLLQDKGPDDQVRIWVPGCATGEEAYSIAILLRERMSEAGIAPKVQIFATDIDDHALTVARTGAYPESIGRDVSPERLERYFVKDGSTYRVLKEIREMCIFSVHNVIKDAPFSKLDLISCRNLLIYLDTALQHRVLLLFHFGLRQGGYLFLGPSENITQHPKLFTKIDSRHRLFKSQAAEAEHPTVEFPLTTSIYRNHLDLERPAGALPPTIKDTISRRAQRVVDGYAPACFVVDERHEILHFSGRTGRYLQPSPGAASLNLFSIVEAGLRPDLRTVIHQSLASGQRAIRENVTLPVDGGFQSINPIVEPLATSEADPKLCVVVLQEVGMLKSLGTSRAEATSDIQKDEIIRHLESELIATRERLQTTIEELETSNEEMKSSNEEFQSLNEEMQSANEELETSKEELQSVNEELETVNAELNSKIESLDRAISDRKNLLESTQIATLFLDNNLRVRSFTPAITEIFHLIESDTGRPITDIVSRLAYEALPRDVSRVLRTLTRLEQEVALADGSASYIMRILPYRTVDNVIGGVVITFIDISERKRNEESLARLAAIIANSQEAIIGMTPDGTITNWNAGAERMYGYSAEEALGRSLSFLSVSDRTSELKQILDRLKRQVSDKVTRQLGQQVIFDTERLTKDGRRIFVSYTASPIRDSSGRLSVIAVVERNTTERRQAEERQQLLLAELNHRVKNTLASVLSIASRTRQSSPSLDHFSRSFEGRVQSLATAHELLAENVWSGADLRQIVLRELQPHHEGKDPPGLSGGEVFLPARGALVFAMVFHELVTNAAKYGALSVPGGAVKVGWRVVKSAASPLLRIDWTERGGPKVEKPTHEGFGLSFVKRSVAYELHGSAELTFKPAGLQCRIEVPMTELRRDREAG